MRLTDSDLILDGVHVSPFCWDRSRFFYGECYNLGGGSQLTGDRSQIRGARSEIRRDSAKFNRCTNHFFGNGTPIKYFT